MPKIVTPDSMVTKLYEAGVKKNPPGILLQDILQKNGGVYETRIGPVTKIP